MKYDYVKRAYIVEQITAAEMQSALRQMSGSEAYIKILEIINSAPAEKVEPVVHCVECEFNNTENKCLYPDSIIKIPGDHDFCSYGKPKGTHHCADVSCNSADTETENAALSELKEFAEDVIYQFGYKINCNGGRLHLTTGGLSTLESAFAILGWDDPKPFPEGECEIDNCHAYATCGINTPDGYKRVCGKHFASISTSIYQEKHDG